MKAPAKDYDTLQLIRPTAIASYLASHGWKELFLRGENKYSYWAKNVDMTTQSAILLPMDNAQLDYPLRVAELLQRLAPLERRSESDIVGEWLDPTEGAGSR